MRSFNAFEFEATSVDEFPENISWIFLSPTYEIDFEPDLNEDKYELTFRGQIGKRYGRWGLGLDGTTFKAGEQSQEFQLRLVHYFYF